MTTQKCAPGKQVQGHPSRIGGTIPCIRNTVPSSQVPDNSAHGSRHLQYTRTFLDIFTLVRCSLRGVVAAGKFLTVPWSRQNCRCDKGQQMWIVACTQGLSKSNSKQGTVICPILVLHVNVAKGKLWTPACIEAQQQPAF